MKRNKLRRIYLVYLIAIGELVLASMLLASGYIPDEGWKLALRIVCCVGFVIMPVMIWVMFRWLKKDNDMASDELEQMVLTRALAAGGLAAISLVPFLLVLVSIFTEWAVLFVFFYTVIVWGTVKLSTFILYRKY
jgi:hypothetical protein